MTKSKFYTMIIGLLLMAGSVSAQGTYTFGNAEDYTLAQTDPGYNKFKVEVANHTSGLTIDWPGLASSIASTPGLIAISGWINSHTPDLITGADCVKVNCCSTPITCRVCIPYNCNPCNALCGSADPK